jgi:hypothetical protein
MLPQQAVFFGVVAFINAQPMRKAALVMKR